MIIISGRSDCAVEGGCVGYSSLALWLLADCAFPPRETKRERSTMNSWSVAVVDVEREGPRWISRGRGGRGDGFSAGQSFQRKGTSYLIAVSSVISKKSSTRRWRKAHRSKKERGRGRTGYAPGVFEVTILGSRLFRSKGSLNLAKLCLFSIWVSTFESPFDQKIGI
jgi:hypothetical protein